MKACVHLIRHGVTEGNRNGWYYGHSDLPLTEEGVALISSLNEGGAYPKPDGAAYYTSGRARAEQTLSLIYGDVPHVMLEALEEISFGDFELKTHKELKADPAYISWINDRSGASAPPGGESLDHFKKRVLNCYNSILSDNADPESRAREKQIVIICHAGTISAIMMSCFDEGGNNMFRWAPDPGHGYTIGYDGGEPSGYEKF